MRAFHAHSASSSTTITLMSGKWSTTFTLPHNLMPLNVQPGYATAPPASAEVRVDGRRFGLTPMAPIPLMEGEHELQLDNKDLKARKVMRITVEAGKDTEVKVKLGD